MKLSVITAGRNDDFGGNFLGRMQISLSVLDAIAARHSIDLETIVVEWNPPRSKKRLYKVLATPKTMALKIITVPPEFHNAIEGADKMPMFEYVAKNVGIRRATNDVILCTNPDIIFSDEMGARLGSDNWGANAFFRAKRSDLIQGDIPADISVEQQWAICKKNVGTVHDTRNAAGDFMLMRKADWLKLEGYPEVLSYGTIDTLMVANALGSNMKQIDLGEQIFHQYHDSREQTKDRPRLAWDELSVIRNKGTWGLGDTKFETYDLAIPKPVAAVPPPAEEASVEAPPEVPIPVSPEVYSKPRCPQCGSTSLGIAGGMRRCNQCGQAWY